jgi:hypothetical protein
LKSRRDFAELTKVTKNKATTETKPEKFLRRKSSKPSFAQSKSIPCSFVIFNDSLGVSLVTGVTLLNKGKSNTFSSW